MFDRPKSPNTVPASKISEKFAEKKLLTVRGRSDHHETKIVREWWENKIVIPQPASQPKILFTPTTSIGFWKIQHFRVRHHCKFDRILRLLSTKSDTWTSFRKYCVCHGKSVIWLISCTSRSNKFQPPSSANMMLAIKIYILYFFFVSKTLFTI